MRQFNLSAFKKVLLFILSFFLFNSYAYSQVTLGIKGGIALSTLNTIKLTSSPELREPFYSGVIYKYALTFNGGLLLDIKLGNLFSLRPELIYNQRGFASSQNVYYYGSRKVTYKVGYIEIPLNLVIGSNLGDGRLEVFVGPSFAYGIGGHGIVEYSTSVIDYNGNTQTIDVKKEYALKGGKQLLEDESNVVRYNNFNVSINIGFSYKRKWGLIQLSYNGGLSNIQPHYEDPVLEDKRGKNVIKASSFTLGLVYLFHKK